MSSFSDLSEGSDIHSISRISRSNCSRIIGRIDSLQNLFEQQCSLSSNANRSSVNQCTNHLEKTLKCITLCEESIGELIKSKLILECIRDASTNAKGTLSKAAVDKLKGLLSIHEFKKYLQLPSAGKNILENLSVLGITDLPKYDFTYEEMLNIKCYVEALLRETTHGFILRYEQLGGSMKEVLKSTDSVMRKNLLEPYELKVLQWKDKFEELCIQYEADIVKCNTLMNEWKKLKYKDTSQIYLKKAEYTLLQAQVAEVQAKITKLSCIIKMYKETPITIDAYRTLNTIVDEKLFMITNEIKEKENLKKQYENLQNTEYDDVLEKYINLCKAIKKKKQILEKL